MATTTPPSPEAPKAGEGFAQPVSYKGYAPGTFSISYQGKEHRPAMKVMPKVEKVGGEVRNPLAGELEQKRVEAEVLKKIIPLIAEQADIQSIISTIKNNFHIPDTTDIDRYTDAAAIAISLTRNSPTKENLRVAEEKIEQLRYFAQALQAEAEIQGQPKTETEILKEGLLLTRSFYSLKGEEEALSSRVADPSTLAALGALSQEAQALIDNLHTAPEESALEMLEQKIGEFKRMLDRAKTESRKNQTASSQAATDVVATPPSTSAASSPAKVPPTDVPVIVEIQKELPSRFAVGQEFLLPKDSSDFGGEVTRWKVVGIHDKEPKMLIEEMVENGRKVEFAFNDFRQFVRAFQLERQNVEWLKEKKEKEVKKDAREASLASATSAKPSEQEQIKNTTGRFKEADMIRLMDEKTGRVRDWKILHIERKGKRVFATVHNKDLGTSSVDIVSLRKFVEDTRAYEEEEKEKEKRPKVSIPPIQDFFSKFNAKTEHNVKGVIAWKKAWIDSGRLDAFRKEYGNVPIGDEQVEDAKKAIAVYVEALQMDNITKELRQEAISNIAISVRILTGVHHPDANDIEYYSKNNILNGPRLEYVRREIEKAKTVHRPKERAVSRPVEGHHQMRLVSGKKVTVDEWRQRRIDKKAEKENEEARLRAESARGLREKHQEMYDRNPAQYLDLYTHKTIMPATETEPEKVVFKSKRYIERDNPIRNVVAETLAHNGITLEDRSKEDELEEDRREQKARNETLNSLTRNRLTYSPAAEKEQGWEWPKDSRSEEEKLSGEPAPSLFIHGEDIRNTSYGAGLVLPEEIPTQEHTTQEVESEQPSPESHAEEHGSEPSTPETPLGGTDDLQPSAEPSLETEKKLDRVKNLLEMRIRSIKNTFAKRGVPVWVPLAAAIAGTAIVAGYTASQQNKIEVPSGPVAMDYANWRSYLYWMKTDKDFATKVETIITSPSEKVADQFKTNKKVLGMDANRVLSFNGDIPELTLKEREKASELIDVSQKVAGALLAAAKERVKQGHAPYAFQENLNPTVSPGVTLEQYLGYIRSAAVQLKS